MPTEHRILYNNLVSIAWTAYLSTLSHVPVVDVEEMSSQLAQGQSQLYQALPKGMQDAVQDAAQGTMRAVDTLLPRGQHFGLDLTIPKQIEIRPTRAFTGDLSLSHLASLFGRGQQ